MMKLIRLVVITLFIGLAVFALPQRGAAQDDSPGLPRTNTILCGNGSESEDYGLTYDFMQPHWTVDWENFVSEDTVNQVDVILDELAADSIAETMILFLPADQVGNRVNCAVHFLRYMKLGLPSGERKDNGFVFLVVVEDGDIDVHYGVGLGLPALTAHDLTDLNRLAEDTYANTGSMDEALLSLIEGYDEYARSKYSPLVENTATARPSVGNTVVTSAGISTTVVCCILCLVALFILFIFMSLLGGGGRRRSYSRPIISMRPTSWGSSSWSRPSSSWSRPSGGGWSAPRMRGGSGSGRSGRGN